MLQRKLLAPVLAALVLLSCGEDKKDDKGKETGETQSPAQASPADVKNLLTSHAWVVEQVDCPQIAHMKDSLQQVVEKETDPAKKKREEEGLKMFDSALDNYKGATYEFRNDSVCVFSYRDDLKIDESMPIDKRQEGKWYYNEAAKKIMHTGPYDRKEEFEIVEINEGKLVFTNNTEGMTLTVYLKSK